LKILTILGTRPEIIRLSRIIPALDGLCRHIVVHTGQNFDPNLSDVFFRELGLRTPDYHLNLADISSSFGVGDAAGAAGPSAGSWGYQLGAFDDHSQTIGDPDIPHGSREPLL
jgi:hypothetical protein